MYRFSKLTVTIAALFVFAAAAVQQTQAQDDKRCYSYVELSGLLTQSINWKVPTFGHRHADTFRPGKWVATKSDKCIGEVDGVKLSIKVGLKYQNLPYKGNLYDGQHLSIRFLNKDTGQQVKADVIKDGTDIDWPRNTFYEVKFQFPGFPAGVDARPGRFAGSSITAEIRTTSSSSSGNRRVYTVIPLKGTSAENTEMLTKLGKNFWELVTVDSRWAYLKTECPLTGGPVQCK